MLGDDQSLVRASFVGNARSPVKKTYNKTGTPDKTDIPSRAQIRHFMMMTLPFTF